MMKIYSLAAISAEGAPVGDCCEFCMDALTKLRNGNVRQAARRSQLHPDKGEEVEEDGEDAVCPHRDEEDKGVVGFRDARIGT